MVAEIRIIVFLDIFFSKGEDIKIPLHLCVLPGTRVNSGYSE